MRRAQLDLSCFVLLACVLVACSASTAPVVKIGLAAPFEGRYRAVGYEAIYAARLAIREINAAGGIGGYRVELFALDDSGDRALAVEQARKMAIDPQVVAAIGHYRPETTGSATDHYCAERLPLLAVEPARPGACREVFSLTPPIAAALPPPDPASFFFAGTVPHPANLPEAAAFSAAYHAIPIDGTRAGPIALQTYDAMHVLFDALRRNIQAEGRPSREGMARALAASDFAGLAGIYRFDAEGNRIGAQVYAYRYTRDREPELIR